MLDFNPVFQSFFTQLLTALLSLFLPYLVMQIVGFLKAQTAQFKASLSNEDLLTLELLTRTAVQAAEQSGFVGYIKDTAGDKRGFAIDFVKAGLASRGLGYIGIDEIVASIEAAVNQGLHRRVESLPAPTTEFEVL